MNEDLHAHDMGYADYPTGLSTKVWSPYFGYLLVIKCQHHWNRPEEHNLSCIECDSIFKEMY